MKVVVQIQLPVDHQVHEMRRQMILNNRYIMVHILQSIHYLAIQNLAFRGHDEQRGNFNTLIRHKAENDAALARHVAAVDERKKKGKRGYGGYLSPRIQNEFIELIGIHFLQAAVLKRATEVNWFSMLADECEDSSKQTMLALFVRYVYYNPETYRWEIREDFLEFLHCISTKGAYLFDLLIGTEQQPGYT